jgi:hypothetical protein
VCVQVPKVTPPPRRQSICPFGFDELSTDWKLPVPLPLRVMVSVAQM